MREKIKKAFAESIAVKQQFLKDHIETVIEVSKLLADTFSRGNKLLIFGNGGSACDASHIAAEFVNRFQRERPAFPALALNTDMGVITSIANDYEYAQIFARQMKALAQEQDVIMALSTSGNSPNVLNAVDVAKKKRLTTIALTGAKGDRLASKCDYVFAVQSNSTPRVQETHIVLGHVLCQMVEEILFEAYRS